MADDDPNGAQSDPSLSNAASATDASPANTTASSARGGPRRAGSLTRGRGRGRVHGPVAAPRGAVRRSAQDRADLEKAEAAKKAEELAAAAAEQRARARGSQRGGRGHDRGGRGRGGGRGGFMGEQMVASGPFSSGQAIRESIASSRRTAHSSGGGGTSGGGEGTAAGSSTGGFFGGTEQISSARSSRPQTNTGAKFEPGFVPVKSEHGGYVSSDDDTDGMPRIDIDALQSRFIDLTGDDDTYDSMAPVRVTRFPHQERNVGTVIAADTGQSDGSAGEGAASHTKGKQRPKDMEITGAWQVPQRQTAYSSSSETEGEPAIKEEPTDNDTVMADAPASAIGGIPQTGDGPRTLAPLDPPSSPESKRKAKDLIKSEIEAAEEELGFKMSERLNYFGDFDESEWQNLMSDRKMVFDELGRQFPGPASEGHDPDGFSAKKAKTAEQTRNNNIYHFQLPGVLPPLVPTSDTVMHDASDAPPSAASKSSSASTGGKKASERPEQPAYPPAGHIGKLRIHQSGKAYLQYGSFTMDVNHGHVKAFPEQVVLVDGPGFRALGKAKEASGVTDSAEQTAAAAAEDAKRAAIVCSMSHVRGSFIVKPDLNALLGDS